MKHLLGRVLTLAVTLSISMGSTALWTGNDLLQFCDDEADGSTFNLCRGFINGAYDGHNVVSTIYKQDHVFCPPKNVTVGQIAKVVVKHLENHPEKLHEMAVGAVYAALYLAFPCEDGQ